MKLINECLKASISFHQTEKRREQKKRREKIESKKERK